MAGPRCRQNMQEFTKKIACSAHPIFCADRYFNEIKISIKIFPLKLETDVLAIEFVSEKWRGYVWCWRLWLKTTRPLLVGAEDRDRCAFRECNFRAHVSFENLISLFHLKPYMHIGYTNYPIQIAISRLKCLHGEILVQF